jgi:hypothetical protein
MKIEIWNEKRSSKNEIIDTVYTNNTLTQEMYKSLQYNNLGEHYIPLLSAVTRGLTVKGGLKISYTIYELVVRVTINQESIINSLRTLRVATKSWRGAKKKTKV